MRNRKALIRHFNKLGFKTGAEIGTERGIFAKMLFSRIPGLKLYCIDPWTPYQCKGAEVSQEVQNNRFLEATNRLSPYNCIIIKKTSMEALKDFEDESLDFVYIDANHEYKYVLEDIREWSKKVKIGGIVSGHDYSSRSKKTVIRAVTEYTKEHNIDVNVTDGEKPGRRPSFWWVKR